MAKLDHQFSETHPHDRTVLFSDAVFAIAITLLALEIRIPEQAIDQLGVFGALHRLIPLFVAYVVSFLVTALFWAAHMQTWKYVTRVSGALLWLNVLQLMFVALIPFSTGLYAEHFGNDAAFDVYCLDLAAVALFAHASRLYVIRSERLVEKLDAGQIGWMKWRSLTAFLVFVACIPLAAWDPWFGRLGFLLIFVMQAVLKRRYRHPHAPIERTP